MKKIILLGGTFLFLCLNNTQRLESYPYDRLKKSYTTDYNGNPTYRDSNGTRYKHKWNYDPNGYGSYKLRGSDGSTLRCTRGYTRDRCESSSW